MIRKISLLIALVVSCTLVQAQLLYEISGKNIRQKSYLFATERLANISFLDSIPNLFKAYGRCNKVVTEFSLDNYEALKALSQAALLPDSARLEDYYSADELQQIDDALRLTLKMGLDKLGRMKPSYLTELYRTELMRRWLQYDENTSMENFFQAVAQQSGKQVIALDNTGEALYMLFDREPFDWQVQQLLNIVQYPERETRLEKELLEHYRNGRLTEISYRVEMPDNQSTLSYSDYQIYARRNLNWTKRLQPLLADGNCFIVLNALYLGGEKGLIQQLRAAGYKVKRVNK